MKRYVLITRHPQECRELAELLHPHDIVVKPYPVLRVIDVDDTRGWRKLVQIVSSAQAELTPAWLVLTSPRAPQRFVQQARAKGCEQLLNLPIAVVGEGTEAAARAAALPVELVGPGTGAGLATTLLTRLVPPGRAILACGRHRRPEPAQTLEAAGIHVLPVVVYEMQPTPPLELPPLGPRADAVVLTSPRAARYYLESIGGHPLLCTHVAFGPTTKDAAVGLGIECRVPAQPTMASLAEELCRIL